MGNYLQVVPHRVSFNPMLWHGLNLIVYNGLEMAFKNIQPYLVVNIILKNK